MVCKFQQSLDSEREQRIRLQHDVAELKKASTAPPHPHKHKKKNEKPGLPPGRRTTRFLSASSDDDVAQLFTPKSSPQHRPAARELFGTPKKTQKPILPISLAEFMTNELKSGLPTSDVDRTSESARAEIEGQVYKFLHVPLAIERIILFGFGICFDHFLWHFSTLLVGIAKSLFKVSWHSILSAIGLRKRGISPRDGCFIIISLLCSLTVYGIGVIDSSRAYHLIKGQSTIKLYVIFNLLEVFDRLCSSFGQDLLESLFWSASVKDLLGHSVTLRQRLGAVGHIVIAATYLQIHSLVLFFQIVTLNVCLNAHNNALVTLMVSNQFVELKGSVFKRFERENLFQISCADIVERFQLFTFLAIVMFLNLDHLTPRLLSMIAVVYISEIAVDWLKHAFITKFNRIAPSTYSKFRLVLSRDIVARRLPNDQGPSVIHRIGFVPLPLFCVVISIVVQRITVFPLLVLASVTFAISFVAKTAVSLGLLTYAWNIVNSTVTVCIVIVFIDIIRLWIPCLP